MVEFSKISNTILIAEGIETYEELALKMSGRYGYTLYQNKPISFLMDRCFLSVDQNSSISLVSSMAMSRPNDSLYDFIVIKKDEEYMGTVQIKDLLLKTVEIEVMSAKQQNPLSGLPGNVTIDEEINDCLESQVPYSVAYLDIDNFKAYNDVYGFESGDMVIKLLADILRKFIPQNQFIGHIGGDDFVVIIKNIVSHNYFNEIIEVFEENVKTLYSKQDLKNGFIISKNRKGIVERFPLITLTCVVINNSKKEYKTLAEISETLARLKKKSKETKQIS